METSTFLTLLAGLAIGVLAGLTLGYVRGHAAGAQRAPADTTHEQEVRAALARRGEQEAVVRESLERLHDQMRDLEQNRVAWQSQLHEQVTHVQQSNETLRRETQTLSTALRRPQVRGRWGELHLRRTVELAGMVERCDFTEQARLDDGALRPDLVVHLAGGREVVVDAKVPLDAFLDATACDDEDERTVHLARHARQLRAHVDALGSKSYWRSLDHTPDFVVLFVPGESFLAAALEADTGLIEHAAARQVVLAGPTTLIALLRTVSQGWTHEALTQQAQQIHRLGRDLHARLGTLSAHLDSVGRSLNAAVGHYNAAMGSLESRVLVSARRFEELDVTDDDLARPRAVELHAVDRRADDDPGGLDRTVGL